MSLPNSSMIYLQHDMFIKYQNLIWMSKCEKVRLNEILVAILIQSNEHFLKNQLNEHLYFY